MLALVATYPCIACRTTVAVQVAHIKAKGHGRGGGGDDWFNLLPLCERCHLSAPHAWHNDLELFFEKFPHVKERLEKRGWIFIEMDWELKLVHPAYRDKKPKQAPEFEGNEESNELLSKMQKAISERR